MAAKRKYIALYVSKEKFEWRLKIVKNKPKKHSTIKDENYNVLTLKKVFGPYTVDKVKDVFNTKHHKFMRMAGEE